MNTPLFAGIRVRNAWYTPAEFQNHPAANIEVELSGEDISLNPDQGGLDRFQLIRRGDNNQFQINSNGIGVNRTRIVDASHVKPLLEALGASSTQIDGDVNQDRFKKALARLQEE